MRNLSLPIFVSWLFVFLIVPTAGAQGTVTPTRVRTLTAEQEEILSHLSIVFLDDGQGGMVKTLRVSDINLQVVNGVGSTDTTNGVGNLIVGYNELGSFLGDDRTGSHNIVGGRQSSFSSHGGLVVGTINTISAPWASVSGGYGNRASGYNSSVTQGFGNTASGWRSSASGGMGNTASGAYSSASGGVFNTASGSYSSVSGGSSNTASFSLSTVSGGSGNTASGSSSSVSGGRNRSVTGSGDWAAGSLFEDE